MSFFLSFFGRFGSVRFALEKLGSFGQVYLTRNTKTNELVATKLVRKDNPNAKLKQEYEWYRILGWLEEIIFSLSLLSLRISLKFIK